MEEVESIDETENDKKNVRSILKLKEEIKTIKSTTVDSKKWYKLDGLM